MAFDQITQIIAIIVASIGITTFVKGIFEYSQESRRKRAEQFLVMRRKFKENTIYKKICRLLDTDDKQLSEINFEEKRDFLGYFEEVALMMNSKLIKNDVAHYMFGYYAIRCWESENFWKGVSKDSLYWSAFADFAKTMIEIENNFHNSKKIRF